LAFDREQRLGLAAQRRNLLDFGLCALAVVPKIRRGHARFELAQANLQF
jgi:hypothetical protein